MVNNASRDILVISDLHLGENLGEPKSAKILELERQLVSFLDAHRTDGRPWRLVVNGDLLELAGVTVLPRDVGVTADVHPHDHRYGLGSRAHAAAVKLELILARHDPVFDALARFLAAGHPVEIVIGNHDIELSWPSVQRVFTEEMVRRAARFGARDSDVRRAFTFHRWFYLERGLVWIEHGHQYDPYCSFEEQLEPATDATEIDPNLGGLLPRYVVPRIGLDAHGLEHSFVAYLRLWLRAGARRLFSVLRAYVAVCWRMIHHWRARAPAQLAARRDRARVHLRLLAEALAVQEELLLELAGLAHAPVSVSLGRIVRALMMDRLLVLTAGPLVLAALLVLLPWEWLPYAVFGASFPLGAGGWMALTSREPTDPSEAMRHSAHRIRQRAGVRFVVMGHSHRPLVDGDATGGYLNGGHWVPGTDRSFTHVRIERRGGVPRATLCQWRDARAILWVRPGSPVAVRLVPAA